MQPKCKKPLYTAASAICILAKRLPWGSATGLGMSVPHCIFVTLGFFSAEKFFKASFVRY